MVIGSMGLLTPMQTIQLASQVAASAAAAQKAIDTGGGGAAAVSRMLASGLVSMKQPGIPLVAPVPVGSPSAAAAVSATRPQTFAQAPSAPGMSTTTMVAIGGGVAALAVGALILLKKKKR